jgi:hypothetical protein
MLPVLLASFDQLGHDVVEMVLADQDGWDRYEAAEWLTMRWRLEADPDDELGNEVRSQLTSEPQRYTTYTREYLGWGLFALMPRSPVKSAGLPRGETATAYGASEIRGFSAVK